MQLAMSMFRNKPPYAAKVDEENDVVTTVPTSDAILEGSTRATAATMTRFNF